MSPRHLDGTVPGRCPRGIWGSCGMCTNLPTQPLPMAIQWKRSTSCVVPRFDWNQHQGEGSLRPAATSAGHPPGRARFSGARGHRRSGATVSGPAGSPPAFFTHGGTSSRGNPLVPPWAPPYGRGRGFRRWRSRRLARHVHRSCVWCASRRGEPGSGGPSLSLSGVSFWGTSRFPLPPPFYPAAAKRQRTTSVLRRPSNFARRRVTANSTPDGVRREITCVRTSRDPKAT
jgi:hypothetical protein